MWRETANECRSVYPLQTDLVSNEWSTTRYKVISTPFGTVRVDWARTVQSVKQTLCMSGKVVFHMEGHS